MPKQRGEVCGEFWRTFVSSHCMTACQRSSACFDVLNHSQQVAHCAVLTIKLFLQGRCNSDPSQQSATVLITDQCPECEADHIDMQALTFNKVSTTLNAFLVGSFSVVASTHISVQYTQGQTLHTLLFGDSPFADSPQSDCLMQPGGLHRINWKQCCTLASMLPVLCVSCLLQLAQ